ncbi:putative sulfotransferase protein [Geminocystis sp. NIES-3708]|nr:putative sulfotransferase protein [Geminocystis sp. NIES-3708]
MKLINNLFIPKKQSGNLPNFIIIGAMKCGTTSLHYYLNCHPEISMSREKELNFFIYERNWNKGIQWYQSQFQGNGKIYGEASPNYTYFPKWSETAKLMYQTVPHAKLIYLVRDPIERLISHYIHHYADRIENHSLTDALANCQENGYRYYLSCSRYYFQLEQYLKYFSPSNILIITTEELSQFPQKTLQTIFKFLEVSENFQMINYKRKLHRSIYKRRRTDLGNTISKLPLINNIDTLSPPLRHYIKKIVYFPFSQGISKPILEKDLKNQLIQYFKTDVHKLRKFTDKDFQEWCV